MISSMTAGGSNFGDQQLWLIKTHAPPNDTAPAIYVIRDGRDATISLSHFDDVSLREVVEGRHKFRTSGGSCQCVVSGHAAQHPPPAL